MLHAVDEAICATVPREYLEYRCPSRRHILTLLPWTFSKLQCSDATYSTMLYLISRQHRALHRYLHCCLCVSLLQLPGAPPGAVCIQRQ
jgi:hypothetical protein